MTISNWTRGVLVALAGAALAGPAVAQDATSWQTGAWRINATLYLYAPSIDGNFAFPKRSGSGEVIVDAGNVFDTLNAAFMGALEVHNGRWGVFTDYLYMDVSGSKSGSRDFSIAGIGIPASLTADLDLGIKGSAWTIAGEYRLQNTPQATVDLLAGARLLDVKPRLSWGLNGEVSSVPIASRGGSVEIKASNWDAIIGLRARYAFGDGLRWYVPVYGDIGTGDSDLTYQAAVGLGYAFGWGDIAALWRYVGYEMKSDQALKDLKFNGPMMGVTFRW